MRTAQTYGRLNRRRVFRWRPVAVALTLALLAVGIMGSVDTASAASHRKHPTTKPKTTPAPALALEFTCAQAWNHVLAVVCVKTQAGAALTIRVTYCGHDVNDANLKGTVHADDKGQYAWSWTPSATCGSGVATVTAKSGGKTLTKSTSFTITTEPGV